MIFSDKAAMSNTESRTRLMDGMIVTLLVACLLSGLVRLTLGPTLEDTGPWASNTAGVIVWVISIATGIQTVRKR